MYSSSNKVKALQMQSKMMVTRSWGEVWWGKWGDISQRVQSCSCVVWMSKFHYVFHYDYT